MLENMNTVTQAWGIPVDKKSSRLNIAYDWKPFDVGTNIAKWGIEHANDVTQAKTSSFQSAGKRFYTPARSDIVQSEGQWIITPAPPRSDRVQSEGQWIITPTPPRSDRVQSEGKWFIIRDEKTRFEIQTSRERTIEKIAPINRPTNVNPTETIVLDYKEITYKLKESAVLRENMLQHFGEILKNGENTLPHDLYASLELINRALLMRRVDTLQLLSVIRKLSTVNTSDQFTIILNELVKVVPRYLVSAVHVWVEAIQKRKINLNTILNTNADLKNVDFLSGINLLKINALEKTLLFNEMTISKSSKALDAGMSNTLALIATAITDGSLILTQSLFGLILLHLPVNQIIPQREETMRIISDQFQESKITPFNLNPKPEQEYDFYSLARAVLIEILQSKIVTHSTRQIVSYVLPYINKPSGAFLDPRENRFSPGLSVTTTNTFIQLLNMLKDSGNSDIINLRNRLIYYIQHQSIDIERVLRSFAIHNYNAPIDLIIAILTSMEHGLPNLNDHVLTLIKSLQMQLIFKKLQCDANTELPKNFLYFPSLVASLNNPTLPREIRIVSQDLYERLQSQTVDLLRIINNIFITDFSSPINAFLQFINYAVEKNLINDKSIIEDVHFLMEHYNIHTNVFTNIHLPLPSHINTTYIMNLFSINNSDPYDTPDKNNVGISLSNSKFTNNLSLNGNNYCNCSLNTNVLIEQVRVLETKVSTLKESCSRSNVSISEHLNQTIKSNVSKHLNNQADTNLQPANPEGIVHVTSSPKQNPIGHSTVHVNDAKQWTNNTSREQKYFTSPQPTVVVHVVNGTQHKVHNVSQVKSTTQFHSVTPSPTVGVHVVNGAQQKVQNVSQVKSTTQFHSVTPSPTVGVHVVNGAQQKVQNVSQVNSTSPLHSEYQSVTPHTTVAAHAVKGTQQQVQNVSQGTSTTPLPNSTQPVRLPQGTTYYREDVKDNIRYTTIPVGHLYRPSTQPTVAVHEVKGTQQKIQNVSQVNSTSPLHSQYQSVTPSQTVGAHVVKGTQQQVQNVSQGTSTTPLPNGTQPVRFPQGTTYYREDVKDNISYTTIPVGHLYRPSTQPTVAVHEVNGTQQKVDNVSQVNSTPLHSQYQSVTPSPTVAAHAVKGTQQQVQNVSQGTSTTPLHNSTQLTVAVHEVYGTQQKVHNVSQVNSTSPLHSEYHTSRQPTVVPQGSSYSTEDFKNLIQHSSTPVVPQNITTPALNLNQTQVVERPPTALNNTFITATPKVEVTTSRLNIMAIQPPHIDVLEVIRDAGWNTSTMGQFPELSANITLDIRRTLNLTELVYANNISSSILTFYETVFGNLNDSLEIQIMPHPVLTCSFLEKPIGNSSIHFILPPARSSTKEDETLKDVRTILDMERLDRLLGVDFKPQVYEKNGILLLEIFKQILEHHMLDDTPKLKLSAINFYGLLLKKIVVERYTSSQKQLSSWLSLIKVFQSYGSKNNFFESLNISAECPRNITQLDKLLPASTSKKDKYSKIRKILSTLDVYNLLGTNFSSRNYPTTGRLLFDVFQEIFNRGLLNTSPDLLLDAFEFHVSLIAILMPVPTKLASGCIAVNPMNVLQSLVPIKYFPKFPDGFLQLQPNINQPWTLIPPIDRDSPESSIYTKLVAILRKKNLYRTLGPSFKPESYTTNGLLLKEILEILLKGTTLAQGPMLKTILLQYYILLVSKQMTEIEHYEVTDRFPPFPDGFMEMPPISLQSILPANDPAYETLSKILYIYLGNSTQSFGSDFDITQYQNKGLLLAAIFREIISKKVLQSQPDLEKVAKEFETFLLDSLSQSNLLRVQWNVVLYVLEKPGNKMEREMYDKIKQLILSKNLYMLLGSKFQVNRYTTTGELMLNVFRYLLTLKEIQEDVAMTKALRYYMYRIKFTRVGSMPLPYHLRRKKIQIVHTTNIESAFVALKRTPETMAPYKNIKEFLKVVQQKDLKGFNFLAEKTRGPWLKTFLLYLKTVTRSDQLNRDIDVLLRNIIMDGPGLLPVGIM